MNTFELLSAGSTVLKEKEIKKDQKIEKVKLEVEIGRKELELIIFHRVELQTTG